MGQRFFLAALALAALTVPACGSGPSGPGPTPPAPQINCGSPVTVDAVVGLSQAVSYPAPTTTGGAAPVSVSCSPPSGSAFPLGNTTVNCTAADAQSRTAACSFAVTLNHRQLTTTKFLAFGDSLTAGENGRPVNVMPVIDVANAYPTYLQQFFRDRIPAQQITVVNAGFSGEKVVDSNDRLKDAIARHQPQVILLLEGINDLNAGNSPGSVANGLADNIRTAKDRGVQYVFVSTLLPVAPGNCVSPGPPCRGVFTTDTQIQQANQTIRTMVPSRGGHLVDVYDLFAANRTTYIDLDGLHLRPQGNNALATAFWDRIVQVIPAAALFGY